MPTRTYTPLSTVDHNSPVSSRVPLEALQMLTQSVMKCSQDYIQPLPLKEDEQQKSPLALLAATCSSIGKTEPTKTADRDNTGPVPPKISADETKSSFKPYKQTAEKSEDMASEKAGFRSPSVKESPSRTPPVEAKEERKWYQYPVSESDSHCAGYPHSPQSRVCGVYVEPGQMHSMHKECASGCPHPSALVPFRGATPYEQAAMRTHGYPSSLGALGPVYPQCACAFCTPHGESASFPGAPRGLPLPHGPATPYMDYLQRTVCREPNCANCKPSPYGIPAVQQCGPHCVQCDSMKAEQPTSTAYPCFYPHNLAMFKGAQDEAHPFVCNWVSGAKHCGKSFATSEDLFQHLRSHTQLGNSVGSAMPQPACNVHGCPCKLRASPVRSAASARYRPYYYKPAVLPPAASPAPMAGCYTTPYAPVHSLPYDPHRLFK